MAQLSIKVDGLRELEAALIDLGSEVAGKKGGLVKTALMAAALPVLRDAQARVPAVTGTLKSQIKRARIRNPRAYNEVVTVGVPLPEWAGGKLQGDTYGLFVEMGTVRMPARPFLRPALESNRDNSTKIFRTRLAVGIEREAKKIGNRNAAQVGARVKKL